jgi:RNA polymerase sigma factor (sigma-70 family)
MVVPFDELLGRLRAGDTSAVSQFVEEYEPLIRRAIRPRLERLNLSAAADSADVCQSVLGTFLMRVFAGSFELNSREDLVRLLSRITQRKFVTLARREYADRRDRRRLEQSFSISRLVDPQAQPGDQALANDLFAEILRRLTDDERCLLLARQAGRNWDDIAKEQSSTAPLLRKRLSRALNRVATELGFEHDGEQTPDSE